MLARRRAQEIPVNENHIPGTDLPGDENPLPGEGIFADQLFNLGGSLGLIDQQATSVVRERPRYDELSLLLQPGEVFAVRRTGFGDGRGVGRIGNDGGVFHRSDYTACAKGHRRIAPPRWGLRWNGRQRQD